MWKRLKLWWRRYRAWNRVGVVDGWRYDWNWLTNERVAVRVERHAGNVNRAWLQAGSSFTIIGG
jgi:hypothetical protein